MKGLSGVYKFNGRSFIYDYDNGEVLLVTKLTKEVEDLFEGDEIVKGKYGVVLTVGLSNASWKDKELRDGYLAEWCDELDYEVESIDVSEFL